MAAPTHECFRAAFTQEPNQTIQPKQALSKALVTSQEPSALRVLKHKKPSDKRISIPTNPAKPDSLLNNRTQSCSRHGLTTSHNDPCIKRPNQPVGHNTYLSTPIHSASLW